MIHKKNLKTIRIMPQVSPVRFKMVSRRWRKPTCAPTISQTFPNVASETVPIKDMEGEGSPTVLWLALFYYRKLLYSNLMGGPRLTFESWKVRNHTKNASQNHFYCFWKLYESWNLAVAWKVPPIKSWGINIFRSLALTQRDSGRTSAGFWLVQIITWWSCDNHVEA